jgi:hypothetical protein
MLKQGLEVQQHISYYMYTYDEETDKVDDLSYFDFSKAQRKFLTKFFSSPFYLEDSVDYSNRETGSYGGDMFYLSEPSSQIVESLCFKNVHVVVRGKLVKYTNEEMKEMYDSDLALNKKWGKKSSVSKKEYEDQLFEGYFKASNAKPLIPEWGEDVQLRVSKVEVEYL